MICASCGQAMSGIVCTCGWTAKKLQAVEEWEIFRCANPDCTTMIRERIHSGGSAFCKWCHARGVDTRVVSLPAPAESGETILLEDFGPLLFEAVKLFSQRETMRRQQEHDVWLGRRDRLQEFRSLEQHLTAQIVALMDQLPASDQQRLLDRFEPVRVSA